MSDSPRRSVSIALGNAIAIAFIVLKLTGTIGWPWPWVLAPIWIPAALVVAAIPFLVLGARRPKRPPFIW